MEEVKKQKDRLRTSRLKVVSGQALMTMTVTRQYLLQANKPISDNDSDSDGDDTVIVGETWWKWRNAEWEWW